MENIRAGAGDAAAINNGFLWILATVPLAWIVQMFLFVAIPLECSLKDAFVLGEYIGNHLSEDPMFARLFWPSVIWAGVVDTIFYILDELEVRRRGFSLGGRLKVWTAYVLPPLYLWVRGEARLNRGTRNLLPYAVWWIGTVGICYFESGWVSVAVSAVIAVIPCIVVKCRERVNPANNREMSNESVEVG